MLYLIGIVFQIIIMLALICHYNFQIDRDTLSKNFYIYLIVLVKNSFEKDNIYIVETLTNKDFKCFN